MSKKLLTVSSISLLSTGTKENGTLEISLRPNPDRVDTVAADMTEWFDDDEIELSIIPVSMICNNGFEREREWYYVCRAAAIHNNVIMRRF